MSAIWYEGKIRYRKTDENGVTKVVTEAFLVDGISYTEAEARLNEELSAFISEDFKITNIKVTNYAEIHPSDEADQWFKAKIALISYDEESGKERKTNIYLLIQANDVKEAHEKTLEVMRNTMGDYTIPSISETAIIDVFPYFVKEEN